VNPKGIPCLYTATDAETAMMETRPWAGSVLIVSQLVLLKQITLFDCNLPASFELLRPPTQEQLESNSWHVLNEAFSQAAFQSDDVADYSPTQYIAEAFERRDTTGSSTPAKLGAGRMLRCSMSMRPKSRADSFDAPRSGLSSLPKSVRFAMRNTTESNFWRQKKRQRLKP
jgi:hypothetical protein